jgi:hypothetical protein
MTTLQLVISLGSTAYAGSVAGAAIGWVARARLAAATPVDDAVAVKHEPAPRFAYEPADELTRN